MFDGIDASPLPQPPTSPTPVAPPRITPPPSALPPTPPTTSYTLQATSSTHIGRTLLIVVIALLVLGGSAYLALFIMSQQGELFETAVDDETSVVDEAPSEDAPADEAAAPSNETQDRNPGTFLDSDGDGLTNAEELEAGTSVTKADTDGDGLGDREEVKVYGTDPKDVDTDGDTYLDGQEVAGGYNPNGSGRLFSVPE